MTNATFEAGHLETRDFPVRGMTCANCAGRVERALGKVAGVHEARVNLATERATVQYDPQAVEPAALTHAVEAAGYQVPLPQRGRAAGARERAQVLAQAEQKAEQGLRRDLIVAASFTVPLLVLAMSHGAIPHSDDGFGRFFQLALATPVLFGPGLRFFRHAVLALRQRAADMNTLVSIGALAAYGYSTFAVFAPSTGHHAPLYFEAGAAIVTFVLLGKLLEQRAKKRLSAAVSGLGQLLPNQATRVLPGGGERYETIALEDVVRGDRLLVRAGERIPNDGQVVLGSGAVDESMLTGESLPVTKAPQAKVFGGTLLVEGSLTVRVSETGADTALARIVDAVERAQGSRAPVAQLADRVSGYFVPFVIACALLTLAVWVALDPSSAGWSFAIERFVTVLVIACPCALGLATPAAVAVGTARAAELGVLFKGGAALEATSQLHTLLFDKTGTLTEGKPTVTDVIALELERDELLALAAAVEQHSAHPVARAIVDEARTRGLAVGASTRFQARAGAGASGDVAGRNVRIGSARWLEGVSTAALEQDAARLAALGRTPSFVAIDGDLRGLIAVADRPTAHAAETLRMLQGFSLAMVTGDREATAHAIARELGLSRVIAEVRPEDKAEVVQNERARTRGVAMIGDGINDAPALAAADVGIAVASGADVALAAADVVLLHGGIASLPVALELARATLHTIRQNLFWAFVYNVVGLPLAAGVLFPWTGWLLSPLFASAAMSLSSVSVLANSLRLRALKKNLGSAVAR